MSRDHAQPVIPGNFFIQGGYIKVLPVLHDPEILELGWENVKNFLPEAKLIAFDGCHKIYLAMDDIEAQWFRDNYGNPVPPLNSVVLESNNTDFLLVTLERWYDESCSLRLISAVYHDEQNPNAGFCRLIAQFAK